MRHFVTVAVLATALFATNASAGARQHFLAGQDYYTQGRYQKAIDEFEEAYRLDEKPLLLYNIAQAYEKLGNLEKAVEYLKKYLEAEPKSDQAKVLQDKIRNIEARMKSTGVAFHIDQDGANVFVDGEKVGTSPIEGVMSLSTGTHKIKIEKPGFETFRMTVAVSAGQTVPVEATLDPAEGGAVGPAAPATAGDGDLLEEGEAKGESKVEVLDIVPWAVAGVGGAAAIVVWAAIGPKAIDEGDTDKALIADIVGFGGVAIAAAGVTWGVVRIIKKKKAAEKDVGASALVVPVVNKNAAGLGAVISF